MERLSKDEKIAQTLKEDKCFLCAETYRYKYYVCKGVSNKIYDVIYFKGLDKWKCNCDNIRDTDCYHIEVCKILKAEEEVEADKKKQ